MPPRYATKAAPHSSIPLQPHHLLRNSASAAPQNQANCSRHKISLKICVAGCGVLQGVGA